MQTLSNHIEELASRMPEGTLIGANELLHLGSRPAIDKALSRLAADGLLLRVGRGLYVAPVRSRFGLRAPATELVVRSWAERHFERVAPGGVASANLLGLTTQVPAGARWFTSGPSTLLIVGSVDVELRHAPPWMFASGLAGHGIRALHWMGEREAQEHLHAVVRRMSVDDVSALLAARGALPTWMAALVSQLVPS